MGTGCIQQIGDVGVIARVVTASTTQAAQDSVKKVVAATLHSSSEGARDNVGNLMAAPPSAAGAKATKVMVATHPSIKDSIPKVATAALPSSRGAGNDTVGNVGATAAKVLVSSLPSKQRSIQKVADADLPSTSGGQTNPESANAADPVTVVANTMKTTIRDPVLGAILTAHTALSTVPDTDADYVLGPTTEPLDPANKEKKERKISRILNL